jgi:hypothetical protein
VVQRVCKIIVLIDPEGLVPYSEQPATRSSSQSAELSPYLIPLVTETRVGIVLQYTLRCLKISLADQSEID